MTGPAQIYLDDDAIDWAEEVARARRFSVVCSNRDTWAHDSPEAALDSEIVGTGGELAFAIWLGVEWEASVDRFRGEGDVLGVEVRTSRYRSRRRGVKVKKWEVEKVPRRVVVWCVQDGRYPDEGRYRIYWVVGWTFAGEAPERGGLYDPSRGKSPKAEAYFVQRENLRPIDAVRSEVPVPVS